MERESVLGKEKGINWNKRENGRVWVGAPLVHSVLSIQGKVWDPTVLHFLHVFATQRNQGEKLDSQ